jgi:hypothetical protein
MELKRLFCAILKLSEQLLSNIKHGNSYQNEIIELSQIRYENLLMELETDNHKKTFGSTFIIHFIKYMQKQF